MSPNSNELVPLPRSPLYAAATWGPYYDAMHPPATAHWMVRWKGVPKWIDDAARMWRQRQTLIAQYEAEHGTDPDNWPNKHPRVTLEGVPACLGCHWLAVDGYDGDHTEGDTRRNRRSPETN